MSQKTRSLFYIRTRIIIIYTIIGFLFGVCFPIGALVLESIIKDVSLSPQQIMVLHEQNPLLYMIDSAPIFLGLFAMLGGFSKAKAATANHKMQVMINELEGREAENQQLLKDFDEELSLNRKITKDIQGVSSQLAVISNELLSNMHELHESDSNVDDHIVSIDASVEEMNAITKSLLEQFDSYVVATNDMYKATSTARIKLDGHLDVSNELIEEIKVVMKKLADLSTLSLEVESVTDLISDISANIKLLALNARIESSRAGEAGKGFAVVATEIQKLSEQTDDAVATISEKIQSVSQGVNNIEVEMSKMSTEGEDLTTTNLQVTENFDILGDRIEFVKTSSDIAKTQMKEQSIALSSISDMIHDVARQSKERQVYLNKSEESIKTTEVHIMQLNQHVEDNPS